MEGWANFCVAQVGASAALAGLVFVGVSINLTKIMAVPHLANVILEAILSLATVLGACSIVLASRQPTNWVGWEILAFSFAMWLAISSTQFNTYRRTPARYRRSHWLNFSPSQAAMIAFIAAGILLITDSDKDLLLYLPATLLCYASALNYAWVLLIEINR